MFDINFYRRAVDWASGLSGEAMVRPAEVLETFESFRSRDPFVYNIETTNACNMRCKMCPRTTRMTRKVSFLEQDVIIRALDQLTAHTKEDWSLWKSFCEDFYGVSENSESSENHFFLYVIPKVIQLHGYGDPLLDKQLASTIRACNDRGLQTYFSCNPANIDIVATQQMIDSGLDYIKYSFESTDDNKFKDIRGNAANFTEAFRKTETVLDYCQSQGADITVVITMIDVGHDEAQIKEFERVLGALPREAGQGGA
jgi:MoaA/NifB/PqqE/SkfB family radical SAM enzyme